MNAKIPFSDNAPAHNYHNTNAELMTTADYTAFGDDPDPLSASASARQFERPVK